MSNTRVKDNRYTKGDWARLKAERNEGATIGDKGNLVAKALDGTEAILRGDKLTRSELQRYASAMAYYIVTDQASQVSDFPAKRGDGSGLSKTVWPDQD